MNTTMFKNIMNTTMFKNIFSHSVVVQTEENSNSPQLLACHITRPPAHNPVSSVMKTQ